MANLAMLIDLAVQLRRDEQAPPSELRRRDREVGQSLPAEASRRERLEAWVSHIRKTRRAFGRADPAGGRPPGKAVAGLYHLALWLLGVLALSLGWGAASVVFAYDGKWPVNIVGVLGVFVVGQWLLLALLVVTMLPRRILSALPPVRAAADGLLLLSPGRLLQLVWSRLSASHRESLESLIAHGKAHQRDMADVQRWTFVHAAQLMAVLFNIGALVCALVLIVLTDLAFGWSTTLEVGSETMHGLVEVLATPWAWAWPSANPTTELVEATRFFRMDASSPAGLGGAHEGVSPSAFGQWWPFVVMCMLVYGLIPRLLTFVLASVQHQRAIDRAVDQAPGVDAVLERIESPLIVTRSDDADASDDAIQSGGVGADEASPETLTSRSLARAVTIRWANVELRRGDGIELAGDIVFDAGGAASLADDRRVIEQVCARLREGRAGEGRADAAARAGVAVFVKSWEPPVGELLDFLRSLREAAGEGPAFHIVPLGLPRDDARDAPEASRLSAWRVGVAKLGDPWTKVCLLPQSIAEAGGGVADSSGASESEATP